MSVREHLQAIYDEHGALSPELVVTEARAEDHPLHSHVFDRPPGDAAEAWYRHRAHDLIQSVKITYKPSNGDEERSVRAFHCVRTEAGHVYEPAEKIAEDPFLRAVVLRDMEREVRQLQARYGHMREFIDLVRKVAEAA